MKSYRLDEWCALRCIPRPTFYYLERRGTAPKTYNVGRRRYITEQADTEWLVARCQNASAPKSRRAA